MFKPVSLVTLGILCFVGNAHSRCELPAIGNGHFLVVDQLLMFGRFALTGTRVILACDAGYKLGLGSGEGRCMASGQWNKIIGTCVQDIRGNTTQRVATIPKETTRLKPKTIILNLLTAARNGDLSSVKNMLVLDADVNIQDTNGMTPLMLSISENHPEVALLLSRQLDIDVNKTSNFGSTALHFATKTGQVDVVLALLKKRAYVNAKNNYNATALMFAAKTGDTNVLRLLLEAKAGVNEKTIFSETALFFASSAGHKDSVKMLLDNDADIESNNSDGDTPLIAASRNGHLSIVQLLLYYQVNVNAQNLRNLTAYAIAEASGQSDITMALVKYGAVKDDSALPI